ncbi:hypothetical protein SDC9_85186 [bioreactor metagenome]|uniref:Uncharacterized protein n=1 Tax=bioreactor metagenome TaxID=1076179 RepID=A0A644ZCZ3_9ZZZZ
MIAAISRIRGDEAVVEDVIFDDGKLRAKLPRETQRVVKFKTRLKGRLDIIGAHLSAALERHIEEIGGIRAAREGQRCARVFLEKIIKFHYETLLLHPSIASTPQSSMSRPSRSSSREGPSANIPPSLSSIERSQTSSAKARSWVAMSLT